MNYIHNIFNRLQLGFILFVLLNPSIIISQEKFILIEEDMPGYELIYQLESHWLGSRGKSYDTIAQRWRLNGTGELQDIYIEYCEFESEAEAISVTSYHSGSFASFYFWGAFNGSIVGDRSWVDEASAIIFVRGNVGIALFKPIFPTAEDRKALTIIAEKILDKIETNLSAEILSLEETVRQKQIPVNDYQKITNDVVNSEIMNDFSAFTTWDSKWMIDTTTFTMGIRAEWKNENGTLVGIDICKFDTAEQAKNAANIQNEQTYSPIFNMDSLTSLETIIDKWVNKRKYGLENNLFSVITTKSNLAVHFYQFDSTKINIDFTYSIIELLVEQIDFF